MKQKIHLLLILLAFLNCSFISSQLLKNLTSSYESFSAYYLDDPKTGDFNYNNRFRSNNYLNIKSNIAKNWNLELQIESYTPNALLNYSPNLKDTGVSTFKFQYINEKIDLTIGNFYQQFGSGMILRSWEDRSLGINNSIRGLNANYRINDQINITALYGAQKKGFKYSKGYVLGIDTEIDVSQIFKNNSTLILGLSYVGRNDNKNTGTTYKNTTNLYSARLDFSSSSYYSNIEIISKSKDPIMQFEKFSDNFVKKGSAFLFNTGFIKNGFGIDVTFRRLENMSIYSERVAFGNTFNESIINYLPALTKQHDYSLTNIYTYQSQPNVSFVDPELIKVGETGLQLDLYYFLKKKSYLGGKYGTNLSLNASLWNNIDGDFDFNNKNYKTNFFGNGEKYFSEISLEIRKKWSPKVDNIILFVNQFYNKKYIEEKFGEINSKILVIETTYKLNKNKSLKLDLQNMSTKDDNKNWLAAGLEYNLNSDLSLYVSDMYNYGNTIKEKKIHYYNFGASYNKGINRYTINYGRQRGGLICYGGICRYVPESNGLSFGVFTSFF